MSLKVPPGGSAPWLGSQLPLRVERPPGGLARALVLHLQEPLVQRQVVSDGVLQRSRSRQFRNH